MGSRAGGVLLVRAVECEQHEGSCGGRVVFARRGQKAGEVISTEELDRGM